MFKADLLCCVCENRGDHIHHLDSDPSNNDFDNLVLVCFNHHNEITHQGGLSRRLSPNLLRRFRTSLHRKIEAKRAMPKLEETKTRVVGHQISEDHLFQLMLDAVSIREIRKIRSDLDSDQDDTVLAAIYHLSSFLESSGVRGRRAVLEVLDDVASRTRFGIAEKVAQATASAAYHALPIRSIRFPAKIRISEVEIGLIEYGLSIGLSFAYDGALYMKNIRVVDAGSELLWKILRYARINHHNHLQQRALEEFATAEDAAKRGGESDIFKLIHLYRKHGLAGDWQSPDYGEKLLDLIS